MPITLNGSGSITGLSSGAGVAATALSGQVPDANAPSGSVLQVVQAITATSADYTTTTPTQRVSLSITPLSAGSRILLLYTAGDCAASGTSAVAGAMDFYRNGSSIRSVTREIGRGLTYSQSVVSGNFLDSPNTTSSITYAVFHWNANASGNFRVGDSNMPSILTAMEISA